MTTTMAEPPSSLPPPAAVLSMLEEDEKQEEKASLRNWRNQMDEEMSDARLEKSEVPPLAMERYDTKKRYTLEENEIEEETPQDQQLQQPLPVAQVLNLFRSSFIEPLFYAGVGIPVHDAASAAIAAAPKLTADAVASSKEVEGHFVGTSTKIKPSRSSPCLYLEDSSSRESSLRDSQRDSKKKEGKDSHRRRIFKKNKNRRQDPPNDPPAAPLSLPPPPSLTTSTTTPLQQTDEAEFVILDYELIATECCCEEEEEEYNRCIEEAIIKQRTCGTVAQSGMRKSVNRVKKWMKNRRAREKARRESWLREQPEKEEEDCDNEENVNISDRSGASSCVSSSERSTKKNRRRRIFKRHKITPPTPPPVPPMATCVPAQLVGYTTAATTASHSTLSPTLPENLDAASAAAYYAALADKLADMAGDNEVVRIQNITREDEFLPEPKVEISKSESCASLVDVPLEDDSLIQEIDRALEEDEEEIPQAQPILRKETVIQESQQLILEAKQLVREASQKLLSFQEKKAETEEEEEENKPEQVPQVQVVEQEVQVIEQEEEPEHEETQIVKQEVQVLPHNEEPQVLEDDDEEELPIIEEVERHYNHKLKLLLIGSPSSGKSTLASSLSPSPFKRKNLNIKSYTPTDDSNIEINVWDLPSNSPNHPLKDTSSLFYSKNGLYILTWDGGVLNPNTFALSHSYQDDEEDLYTSESLLQKADRALERSIDSQVLPILLSLIQSNKAEDSVIVPVMTYADVCVNHEDVRRRCTIFRRRLDSFLSMYNKKDVKLPKIVFGEENQVLTLSKEKDGYNKDDVTKLRQTISSLTYPSSSPAESSPFNSHLNKHIPRLTVTIQEVLQSLQSQNVKIISTAHLLQKIRAYDEEYDGISSVSSITSSLEFLSSVGQILYYQDTEDKKTILNEFVILDVKWLTSAISCILSHNLRRELVETREFMTSQVLPWERRPPLPLQDKMIMMMNKENVDPSSYRSANTFLEEKKMDQEEIVNHDLDSPTSAIWNLLSNCAAITSYDASMMWQSMNFMREAVEKAYSSSSPTSSIDYEEHSKMIFSYLHALMVHHGVFVPVNGADNDTTKTKSSSPTLFLLPSLFTETVPSNVWSYKTSDAWITTLSHSWLFRDVVLPTPNFMAQVMATVLKDVTNYTHISGSKKKLSSTTDNEGAILQVQQFHCWKSAFLLELGLITKDSVTNECTMSKVEIFAHLDSADSKYCVASDVMTDGMRRLVVSAKGQIGCGGRRIWEGGYDLVLRSVDRVVNEYMSSQQERQLQHLHKMVEREIACPKCLALHHHNAAALLKHDHVLASSKREDGGHIVRCRRGHALDSATLCGVASQRTDTSMPLSSLVSHENSAVPTKAVKDLMGGVVLVGLWDGDKKEIVGVGTGFIADRKQGLVITASHVLMEIRSGHKKFGRNYFGLKHGKAVIGVIPRASSPEERRPTKALFRYFAEIVAKDVEHMDACVLRITTRMEEDVGGQGGGCGDQPEIPLMNDLKAIKAQKLQQLHMTRKFAIEEGIRILGFNQGGEGLVEQGAFVHRTFDFVRGYVSEEFENDINVHDVKDKRKSIGNGGETLVEQMMAPSLLREPVPVGTFNPTEEIVVRCPTIPGHSGGPCVNHDGRVIGILSRADPTERERCYLVPTSELKVLMEKARAVCDRNPMDVMGELWK